MALYKITLEKMHIDHTRSLGDDNDLIAFALHVGDFVYPPLFVGTGDVDDDFDINLTFEPVFLADPQTSAFFCYQILNRHGSDLGDWQAGMAQVCNGGIAAWLAEGGAALASWVPSPWGGRVNTNDDPFRFFTHVMGALFVGIPVLYAELFSDCNGIVAAEIVGGTRADLDKKIDASGGTYRQVADFPGLDSPDSCGSRSHYSVTWSVTRTHSEAAAAHHLRPFLQRFGINPQQGLRAIVPSRTSISLRSLMGIE
jgi:hypothetical protein